jgi:hypothetical protein
MGCTTLRLTAIRLGPMLALTWQGRPQDCCWQDGVHPHVKVLQYFGLIGVDEAFDSIIGQQLGNEAYGRCRCLHAGEDGGAVCGWHCAVFGAVMYCMGFLR